MWDGIYTRRQPAVETALHTPPSQLSKVRASSLLGEIEVFQELQPTRSFRVNLGEQTT